MNRVGEKLIIGNFVNKIRLSKVNSFQMVSGNLSRIFEIEVFDIEIERGTSNMNSRVEFYFKKQGNKISFAVQMGELTFQCYLQKQ